MKKTYRLDYTKNYKDQTSRKQTTQWGKMGSRSK